MRHQSWFAGVVWGSLFSTGTVIAQTCVSPPANMVAWWTLDETSGSIANDSIGTEPAAYFGSPAAAPVPGLVAGALKFNGQGDFLSAPDSTLWAFGSGDFTIELWANFSSPPGGSVSEPSDILIGHDEGGFNRNKWFFGIGGGYLYFHMNGPSLGPQFLALTAFSPTVNQWYHLAVTKAGQVFTIYINGTGGGSSNIAAAVPTASAPLTIGQAESIGFLNGLLDEVSVYNRALSATELKSIVTAGAAGKCKVAATAAVSPSVGGNTGQVTVTLSGSQFTSASTVELTASGFPSIPGSALTVSANGTSLVTTFDLTGQPLGVWNVVLTTPNLPTVTLANAFTVEAGTPPAQVWAAIVGRGAIRVNQTQEFAILYGNSSDTDAINVPIWLSGIPLTATIVPQFTTIEPPAGPGFPPIDASLPITITTANDIELPLIITRIPAGSVGSLQFSLMVVDNTPIELVTTVNPPFGVLDSSGSSQDGASRIPTASASTQALPSHTPGVQASLCLVDLTQLALSLSGITDLYSCANQFANTVAQVIAGADSVATGGSRFLAISSMLLALTEEGLTCFGKTALPPVRTLLNFVGDAVATANAVNDCLPVLQNIVHTAIQKITVVSAYDPNSKQGSQGAGAPQYLSGAAPWPYTIAFENDATASAAAQTVTVTDQLDTTNFDLSTFSLGAMGFGTQQVVPPPGLSEFSTYIDLRPATNLLVGISAALNKSTGVVTWAFSSLDPSTGQAPSDPTLGFLPPDKVPPEGDGQVAFSILPKSTLSTGQQIHNTASVVFDTNAPVVTATWSNTLDTSAPVSQVAALPASETAYNFPVQWSGSDAGSGIQSFTVYVSDTGGPYAAWLTNTAATQGAYTSVNGHSYSFYSIARDLVGNLEKSKTAAETATTVQVSNLCHVGADASVDASDVQLMVNQALGVGPAVYDLNSDGVVNVVDLQMVLNSALGFACGASQG